jgi:outer membrane protein assembly factor BamB
MMKQAAALLSLLTLLLAACGGKENVRQPAPLLTIDQPALQARTVWNASVSSGDQYTALRLALEPDALVAAGEGGEVLALDPSNGKPL